MFPERGAPRAIFPLEFGIFVLLRWFHLAILP
ncbi:hypothetical protein DEU52_1618 [Ensifer adhaerens]|nr:hypothetical protein DEU52_1618 [Ensifer adhaerens]